MTPGFDTIDLLDGQVFQVTWDLGRRCSYDCSYCPSHRHDQHSPFASLDDLKKNVHFIFKYISLYMKYRSYKSASINFTGGEPTIHPNFAELIEHTRVEFESQYANKFKCTMAVTSNGAMNKKVAEAILKNLNHITISYHAEASVILKEQVKRRIVQFSKEGPALGFNISINVMFHAAYFEECLGLCQWLDSMEIRYVPRIIGEEPESASNFAHSYTQAQLEWFKNYWNENTAKVNYE